MPLAHLHGALKKHGVPLDTIAFVDVAGHVLWHALSALASLCRAGGCDRAPEQPAVPAPLPVPVEPILSALRDMGSDMLCDDCFALRAPATHGTPAEVAEQGMEALAQLSGCAPADAPAGLPSASELMGFTQPITGAAVMAALKDSAVTPLASAAAEPTPQPGLALGTDARMALHCHTDSAFTLPLPSPTWPRLGSFQGALAPALQEVERLGGRRRGASATPPLHPLVAVLRHIVHLDGESALAASLVLYGAGVPHATQPLHVERPDRLRAALWGLRHCPGLHSLPSRLATGGEVATVHTPKHTKRLLALWQQLRSEGGEAAESSDVATRGATLPAAAMHGGDMYYTLYSLPAALLAAGTTLEVTAAVLQGRAANGLAVVRPPGHHATAGECMGFCLVNNAAVAARVATTEWGLDRVAILDWDVHHGNGTQDIFQDDPRVLYASLHRYNAPATAAVGEFYPGSGSALEVGGGGARGTTLNIPWPGGGVGDASYAHAFRTLILPVFAAFKPQTIFISAGFDAALYDPLGGCCVTPGGYAWMTHQLHALCPGRVIVVMEGGYNLRSIALSFSAVGRVLAGQCATAEATGGGAADLPSPSRTPEELIQALEPGVSAHGGAALPDLDTCAACYNSDLALHGMGGPEAVWEPDDAVSHEDCCAAVREAAAVHATLWPQADLSEAIQ